MNSQHNSSGRRVITACSECHRRKQKCDRRSPCNNCVARKVAGKCLYREAARIGRAPQPVSSTPSSDGADEPALSSRDEFQEKGDTLIGQHDPNQFLTSQRNNDFHNQYSSRGTSRADPNTTTRNHPVYGLPSPPSLPNTNHRHLPSTTVLQELVDVYFTRYNPQFNFVERCYFDDLFKLWLNHGAGSLLYFNALQLEQELDAFPALLFQILGLVIQFLPPDTELLSRMTRSERDSAQRYSDISSDLMKIYEARKFSITAVQAYLLRAVWLKNVGRAVEAWHSLGTAVRHAQELRLHEGRDVHQDPSRKVTETLSLFWLEEYRRRLWANLFVYDGLMALMLGRPRTINTGDCDFRKPMNCDIPTERSEGLPLMIPLGSDPNAPNTASLILPLYELVFLFHEMRTQKTSTPHPTDYSIISDLHDRASHIIQTAPAFLRQHSQDLSWDPLYPHVTYQRENLLSMINLFLITLHRPHVGVHAVSQKAALQASITILESQQRIFDLTPRHLYSYVGSAFCTIDAALLLCVMSTNMRYRDSLKQRIEHLLDQSTERLTKMQVASVAAKSGLQVLQDCSRKLKSINGTDKTNSDFLAPVIAGYTPGSSVNTTSGIAPDELDSSFNVPLEPDISTIGLPDLNMDFNYFDTDFWLGHLDQIPLPVPSLLEHEVAWDAMDFE
ncbi:Zn2/Cys6 DNA-binding protein [Glarea lozoyensis ATCC 20868]|uniref:Zn2/Cys6 DNA-binding protein n=1 Tax=Glarea lozoyensis (strain ATCC 20868 / MF5171) TaxID=1116229 RepID=S3CP48_GLAL2|nr:Zn2/Cys6 DNA-binding protein [Glarea lozoyensis ATCC 20868]EPE27490.1 Zn2/Cys6 DNA-binding protein [Glarea lozoyensis ATCC 20868]